MAAFFLPFVVLIPVFAFGQEGIGATTEILVVRIALSTFCGVACGTVTAPKPTYLVSFCIFVFLFPLSVFAYSLGGSSVPTIGIILISALGGALAVMLVPHQVQKIIRKRSVEAE